MMLKDEQTPAAPGPLLDPGMLPMHLSGAAFDLLARFLVLLALNVTHLIFFGRKEP